MTTPPDPRRHAGPPPPDDDGQGTDRTTQLRPTMHRDPRSAYTGPPPDGFFTAQGWPANEGDPSPWSATDHGGAGGWDAPVGAPPQRGWWLPAVLAVALVAVVAGIASYWATRSVPVGQPTGNPVSGAPPVTAEPTTATPTHPGPTVGRRATEAQFLEAAQLFLNEVVNGRCDAAMAYVGSGEYGDLSREYVCAPSTREATAAALEEPLTFQTFDKKTGFAHWGESCTVQLEVRGGALKVTSFWAI